MFNYLIDKFLRNLPAGVIGLGLILIALVVMIQIWRGDALICADGTWFGKRCNGLTLPKASILLSLGECKELGSEWHSVSEASGRFVIAAGTNTDAREETKSFVVGQLGGEYSHLLTISEMPSHTHRLDMPVEAGTHRCAGNCRSLDKFASIESTSQGKNSPHNNIPPYIVMNFCTRNLQESV